MKSIIGERRRSVATDMPEIVSGLPEREGSRIVEARAPTSGSGFDSSLKFDSTHSSPQKIADHSHSSALRKRMATSTVGFEVPFSMRCR